VDRSDSHKHLLEKHERERSSVSQSPRLEAVSVMLKPVPLIANCLIKTDHSGTTR
jgi:hypothetical protein